MKVYECVQVKHHKDIGRMIETWQRNGWHLHTYQAIGTSGNPSHYLLFERENDTKASSVAAAAAAAAAAT